MNMLKKKTRDKKNKIFPARIKKMRVLFVKSDGKNVTEWFSNLLKQIPNVEFVDSKEECDIVCIGDLTTNCHTTNTLIIANYVMQYANKQLAILLHDDPDSVMGFPAQHAPSLLVFRTSMLASQRQPYERFLPSFQCEDQDYKCLEPLELKPNVPIPIGFVGARTAKERAELCEMLYKDDRFQTNFMYRGAFHGHFNDMQQAQHNAEYKENIAKNMYQLCCRGTGNFSHRFYEVLASGRVPVLPDTDMVIPPHIPPHVWRNCVVMASNTKSIPDAVYAFHVTHNMVETQTNCRNMWNTYLSYKGFASVVAQQFESFIL